MHGSAEHLNRGSRQGGRPLWGGTRPRSALTRCGPNFDFPGRPPPRFALPCCAVLGMYGETPQGVCGAPHRPARHSLGCRGVGEPRQAVNGPSADAEACVQLKNNSLAGYLKQRFKESGHRIFRLLLEHKYLPVEEIEKIALVSTRVARTALHSLFQHGYIKVQERP